jgi:hypothetical protein
MSLPASDARFVAGVRLFNHRRATERAVVWAWPRYPLVSARGSSHQSKNCFTARTYAKRVLRLRIAAVKNSMKRRLARSPTTRTIADSASSAARTNAGGGYLFRRPARSCDGLDIHQEKSGRVPLKIFYIDR